ncbi:MAG: hypothetical protein KKB30_00915 [Proteobacteria bacterium]|nr:hypothetical protein [Pseudomonadota bacterium]MBU1715373.1 hypothetical protein [Pseudomonadota bacterium]
MTELKNSWDLKMAMEVMRNQTVDSKLWAEAVKWLMLYGPPEIQEMIQQASIAANRKYFPDIKPKSFNELGQPCYDIKDIAAALHISEQEAFEKMAALQVEEGIQIIIDESDTHKIQ